MGKIKEIEKEQNNLLGVDSKQQPDIERKIERTKIRKDELISKLPSSLRLATLELDKKITSKSTCLKKLRHEERKFGYIRLLAFSDNTIERDITEFKVGDNLLFGNKRIMKRGKGICLVDNDSKTVGIICNKFDSSYELFESVLEEYTKEHTCDVKIDVVRKSDDLNRIYFTCSVKID